MKKKNLILLSVICILSLCVFTGLLVYAFDLQSKRDLQNNNIANSPKTSSYPSGTGDNSGATVEPSPTEATKTPTPTIVPEPSPEADSENLNNEEQNAPISPTPLTEETNEIGSDKLATDPIVLAFAGDVNFSEASKPMAKYDTEKKGILGGISGDLVEEMKAADIMMLNNEFPYSKRGTKTADKSYTFRADPSRVSILGEMGVDIVSLANNHALDYGPDALEDTFATLDGADIDYIGAGRNMDRARAPIYYTVGDKKIAYLAASRVVFAMDWYATDNRLGMIGTYDPTLILESIEEAAANSDYVVVFLHWGKERNNHPEQYQRNLATQYIDVGADAVIGCHPHVLQGFEYYKGKPIAYSLGNYWFNSSTREAGLLKLYLEPEGTVKMQMLPTMGADTYTYLLTKEVDRKKYFSFLQKISYGVTIDEDGFVTEKKE